MTTQAERTAAVREAERLTPEVRKRLDLAMWNAECARSLAESGASDWADGEVDAYERWIVEDEDARPGRSFVIDGGDMYEEQELDRRRDGDDF
jgi:hypothetical protein